MSSKVYGSRRIDTEQSDDTVNQIPKEIKQLSKQSKEVPDGLRNKVDRLMSINSEIAQLKNDLFGKFKE